MIENLFGGGGGGGLESVVAGTGISVDNTNPDNPIITNTSLNTDETAKVSSNDTTAGYLNGKLVAGSGILLTENNNGGNETLAIAAAVTSVNGQTGAVTVSGGDTKYVVTLNDVENTSTAADIWSITIPANTWADGEIIYVDTVIYMLNNTGTSQTLTYQRNLNGSLLGSTYTQSITNSGNQQHHWSRNIFQRQGSNLVYTLQGTDANFLLRYTQTYHNPSIGYQNFLSSSATFTSDITLTTNFKWTNANANLYARMMNAVAYKLTGQYA